MNEDWDEEDEAPPRDMPEYGDFAVTRSVGVLTIWRQRLWRWDGERWQYVPTRGSFA